MILIKLFYYVDVQNIPYQTLADDKNENALHWPNPANYTFSIERLKCNNLMIYLKGNERYL